MTAPGFTPRVSVLMTVLKAHPVYFPQAVRSILAQTFPDFELLIVEDPSSSLAGPLLRSFDDPRIRHHLNPRRTSLIEQKNQGLAAARGDLVALIDADDVAEPDRLEKQVHFLETYPEVAVLGSQVRIIDGAGRSRGYRTFPLHHEAILRALPSIVPLSQPSVMLRKEAVLKAGGYAFRDYAVAEDYELWSRLALGGLRFANHAEALLRYRVHRGQMKATHLRETIRAILHIKRLYWRRHMDGGARLRAWVEWTMLAFPPLLVHRLFTLLQYRPHLPLANGSILVRPVRPGKRSDDAPVLHRRLPAFRHDPAPAGPQPPSPGGHRHGDDLLLPVGPLAAATGGARAAH
jgi:glycosyltransferase involved in cell wall biosynthesis